MTGLAALSLVFATVGFGALWGLRGWEHWTDMVRLAGFAYLLGVALLGVALSQLLALGLPLTVPVVLVAAAALALGGLALGLVRRRPRPAWRRPVLRPEPLLGAALVLALAAVVQLEAYFRVARTQPLEAWDAWAFWTPKAMTIYHFGGLDADAFPRFPGPSYPLLVPALQAAAFRFMGGIDVVTLHLLFWALAAAFVFATVGLLRPRVPLVLVWPFAALLVAMPEFTWRAIQPQADLTLDYFFVLAGLCLGLWLLRREPWLLPTAAIFLAAATNTKREGQLLAACLLVAALAATGREWRTAWWRLAAVGGVALAATVPWRVWRARHGIEEEVPPLAHADYWDARERLWPALELVLRLLFSVDLWLVAAPVGVAAGALLALAGGRRLATLYLVTMALGVLGFTWILYGFPLVLEPSGGATPIPRAVGALVLLSLAFAPLMVWSLLEHRLRRA